jgi:CheY-like chemotaxis protein
MRILYLDDDESLVLLTTRLLERQGYRVSGHTDARAALAELAACAGQFDLVISDYNMPVMSGLEVARAMLLIRPDLPVVLTSGYITEELRASAPAAGVRELIYKPSTVEELGDVVMRLLKTLYP